MKTKTLEQLIAKAKEVREQKWGGVGNTGLSFFQQEQHTKLNILGQLILTEAGATNVLHNYWPTYDILKWYYEDIGGAPISRSS